MICHDVLVHVKRMANIAGIVLVACAGQALAFDEEAEIKLGEAEYMLQCASCHGATGHGDGPVAEVLAQEPPDLTLISSRFSGQFPAGDIQQIIDGRNMINPHGDRGMPIWGDRYFQIATERSQTVPHDTDAQAMAYGRVVALVKYLASIQAD